MKDLDGKTVIVGDSTGRVGNHLFTYLLLGASKLKYNLNVYQSLHTFGILSIYFDQLSIPIAETELCGFDETYSNYKEDRYNSRIERLKEMVENEVGHPVNFTLTETGKLNIPQDLLDGGLKADQLVHNLEFSKTITYIFDQTHFPWQQFNRSFAELEQLQDGHALILEKAGTDDDVHNVPGIVDFMSKELKLRQEFIDSASITINKIAEEYQNFLASKKRKSKPGKKFKKKTLTFVGIHSRRTDYLPLQKERGMKQLTPRYFQQSMDYFRYSKIYNFTVIFKTLKVFPKIFSLFGLQNPFLTLKDFFFEFFTIFKKFLKCF